MKYFLSVPLKTNEQNRSSIFFCYLNCHSFNIFSVPLIHTVQQYAVFLSFFLTLSAQLHLILRLETGAPVRIKPFGVEVRNVRCLRCGNYGHQSGDRECPLKDVIMPNEESRLKRDDPLTTIMAQTDSSEVRFFYFSLKYYFLSQFP